MGKKSKQKNKGNKKKSKRSKIFCCYILKRKKKKNSPARLNVKRAWRTVLLPKGPKTRERSLRPGRSRPGRRRPGSRLKFQGAGTHREYLPLEAMKFEVWDVILDRWPGG